jgi:hypothetical protein
MSMKTDDLIERLSDDLPAVGPGAVARRIALGLGLGAAASAALMLLWLGLRSDLAAAVATRMFWMKFGYSALTGMLLAFGLVRLSRPAARVGLAAAIAAAPFLLVAGMAVFRLVQAAPEARMHLIMGGSAHVCPWRILVIGLPILAGAVWAVRGLAPTRLALAGLVAGGCAGGLGAAIYAFHCEETAAPFLAIWYTLGMGLVAAIGAMGGSRWLRWT